MRTDSRGKMASSPSSTVEMFANHRQNSVEEKTSTKEGGCLRRPTFQVLLISSLVRLTIYLNKLYQDVSSVSNYYNDRDFYYAVISIAVLIIPPVLYAAYLTGESLVKKLELDSIDLSTRTINGLLLIPWQIKRHLDVLYFAAQRVCFWRKPTTVEKEDISQMERTAETLEFFEDFYAGFIQILLQLYIIIGALQWNWKTSWMIGQIVGSSLSILSLIFAVRRRDDGPMTTVFSFVGWVSLFTSRILVLGMVSSYIHWSLTLVFCLLHILAMTIWIYRIALESHENSNSTPHSNSVRRGSSEVQNKDAVGVKTTRQKFTLWWLTFWFFGFPSLLYWPIMFQLKDHKRPQKFLGITFAENMFLLLISMIPLGFKLSNNTQLYLVIGALTTTFAGLLFLFSYITCKPKYTDLLVLHEMKVENSHSYGIYYEFCDIVFRLPLSDKIAENLETVRRLNENL